MNRGMNTQVPQIESQFFDGRNENYLLSALQNTLQREAGQLNERQVSRLGKMCKYYMNQVWEVNGPMPIQELNNETYNLCITDFSSYLRRDARASTMSQQVTEPPRPDYGADFQRISMDTGARFSQLQTERQTGQTFRPQIPDLLKPMDVPTGGMDALNMFEVAKKQREDEAQRVNAAIGNGQQQAMIMDRLLPAGPAELFQSDANQNPTTVIPNAIKTTPTLSQEIVVRQEPVVEYRETEHNLFIYSADRDWLNNTRENRYNFSVNFDPANNRQGFTFSPSANIKFKNITRIELVKMIVPAEGVDTLVRNTGTSGSPTYNSATRMNILSFPYSIVRISELDGNNYGTDNYLDNSFGVIQYDANWVSDNDNMTDSKGYLALIPKFQKCQRVYAPTPLSTLNKLTIRLERPTGSLVSEVDDTLNISGIYSPGSLPAGVTTTSAYNVNDASSQNQYIFLKTSKFFSRFAFSATDRIQIKGLDVAGIDISGTTSSVIQDGFDYLQGETGHLVVGIGYLNASNVIVDGPNNVGYANILILRNRFVDPTTGSILVSPFGSSSSNLTKWNSALKSGSTTISGARLINHTHQTTLVLRIITREMDSTSRVRPDNLY
jgi:hypothetical protein